MRNRDEYDFEANIKIIEQLNQNYQFRQEEYRSAKDDPTSPEKREKLGARMAASGKLGEATATFQSELAKEMLHIRELCVKLNNTSGFRSLFFKPKETRTELIEELAQTLANIPKSLDWAIQSKLFLELDNFPKMMMEDPAVQKAARAIQAEASIKAATPGSEAFLKVDAAFNAIRTLATPKKEQPKPEEPTRKRTLSS